MPIHWRARAFTQDEAADLAGLEPGCLRVWVCRNKTAAFSEKRGSRRWFSPQDICVLRIARELAKTGKPVAQAITTAGLRLVEPPSQDEIMVVRSGDARTVVQLGEIAAAVIAACQSTYQN
jgi:hypothetical protein